mgnify:CR=1 FL=1
MNHGVAVLHDTAEMNELDRDLRRFFTLHGEVTSGDRIVHPVVLSCLDHGGEREREVDNNGVDANDRLVDDELITQESIHAFLTTKLVPNCLDTSERNSRILHGVLLPTASRGSSLIY